VAGAAGDPGKNRLPPNQATIWATLGLAVVIIGGLFGVRLEHQPETTRDYPLRQMMADGPAVMQPAPEIDDEYLPCRDCHTSPDRRTGPIPRELEYEHEDTELAHGNLWCLHCHDPERPGRLRLADASLVKFEDSWQLCTQCHAKKLPEWRAGVHGKQTGYWRGPKEYRTCVVCHEPHSPPFGTITPKPRPRRPDEIVNRAGDSGEEKHGDS
jgi:hypothetical protein